MTTHEIAIADYFTRQSQVYILEFRTWRGQVSDAKSRWALENARTRLNMARTWYRIAGILLPQ